MWYIEAILILYVLAPIVYKSTIKRPVDLLLMTMILSVILLFLTNYPQVYSNEYMLIRHFFWGVDRLPVFVLGMIMYSHIGKISLRLLMVSGVMFFLLAIVSNNFQYLKSFKMIVFVCLSTPGISLLLGYCRTYIERLHLLDLFLWLGKNSLLIYLSHEFVYKIFYNHLQSLGGLLSFALSLFVVFVIVTITNRVEITIKENFKY